MGSTCLCLAEGSCHRRISGSVDDALAKCSHTKVMIKNEGVKNIDDGEEGSYYVPAAAVLAGSDAGITGESRRLIATGTA